MCSSLPTPPIGSLTYATDTTEPFNYLTTATYDCGEGYVELTVRERVRTCLGSASGPGEWSGTSPLCTGKLSK